MPPVPLLPKRHNSCFTSEESDSCGVAVYPPTEPCSPCPSTTAGGKTHCIISLVVSYKPWPCLCQSNWFYQNNSSILPFGVKASTFINLPPSNQFFSLSSLDLHPEQALFPQANLKSTCLTRTLPMLVFLCVHSPRPEKAEGQGRWGLLTQTICF